MFDWSQITPFEAPARNLCVLRNLEPEAPITLPTMQAEETAQKGQQWMLLAFELAVHWQRDQVLKHFVLIEDPA